MKRFQILLVGAFLVAGSGFAQTEISSDAQAGIAQVKQLISSDLSGASAQAEQLVKGKNKSNVALVISLGRVFLDAGKLDEADKFFELAKKANSKSAQVYVYGGDIALSKKDAGTACQMYEQAMYFEPKSEDAYFKYANVYKATNPQLSIEKLQQLKDLRPDLVSVDKNLAEVYYFSNQFKLCIEEYDKVVGTPIMTEDDLIKYAFALFVAHDFDKSLSIVSQGLAKNPKNAFFNRLAMYNYTDLKKYDEAVTAADNFFNNSDKIEYNYLDYTYYGHLLNGLKKYAQAGDQFKKALSLDSTKTELYRELSDVYEKENDYANSIGYFLKYFKGLPTESQTPDLLYQLGRIYYGAGTDNSQSASVTAEMKKSALLSADSIFAEVAKLVPESYLGNFWRARANSALDPETSKGLAKPYYELSATFFESKNDSKYRSSLIECYSYLGYYYMVANKMEESKGYWNKILSLDPNNATAKKAMASFK